MRKGAFTLLHLLIVIVILAIIIILLINNPSKWDISAPDKPVIPATDTVKKAVKKEETKVLPSDIEEAFVPEDFETDFVSKDRIPKLKIKSKNDNSDKYVICGSNYYSQQDNTEFNIISNQKPTGKSLELMNCKRKGYFVLDGIKYSCPFKPQPITGEECLELKNKLGIINCLEPNSSDKDYWAGAVKTCGGVKNLPNMEEIGRISTYVYEGNPNIGAYGSYRVKYYSGMEDYLNLWTNEQPPYPEIPNVVIRKDGICIRSLDFHFSNESHDIWFGRGSHGMNAICKLN